MTSRLTKRRALATLLAAGVGAGTWATALPALAAGPRELTAPAATSLSGAPADGDGDVSAEPKADATDKLGAHDQELLVVAQSKGAPTVNLMLATRDGRAKAVVAALGRLGAQVGYRNDRIGYVRATVPTGAVIRAAALKDVLAIDLDEKVEQPDPRPEGRRTSAAAVAAPGARTPDSNPYMPTNETGAVAFKKANRTWDGRGVTIGVIDSGVDLDHPSLQTTSTGERKIVDWVTAVDPLLEGDRSWRPMLTSVTGPTFTSAGSTWTAPAGTYRFNRFSENITTGSEPAGDVNRDGDTTDIWGVLYDPATNDIWVDVDNDKDFTDEVKQRPYREQFQVRHFGTDNPATAVREQMPFVVEFREDVDLTPAGLPGQKTDFVNIGIVESAHGSHVAGITAAHAMFGGDMDGAAPGAKIVSSRACSWGGGCTAIALTEGMIDLVANRNVDVVNMSIGGLPALNDGNNARARLYDRLIDTYGVQLFISAGNSGPGVNTIGDPSVATDVVSVGASVSKETWLSNYGSRVTEKRDMFNFSSRGPREDGGFKPTVTAPGSAISTTPLWQPGSAPAETGYTLPPGYSMFNGTSMASPQAAGAAALLLSAGFANDIPITAKQMRTAMTSTADYDKGVAAYAQGHGQVDVGKAWRLVRRQPTTNDVAVAAPVCTPISDFLATPDRGTGIYNRCAASEGGQRAGTSRTYTVDITRTSGRSGSVNHKIRWVGNDGTWSSASSVSLPLNRTTSVRVLSKPRTAGAHGAIMQIDDPRTRGLDHAVMNTVFASNELAKPSFGFSSGSQTVQRNLSKSYFVTVPEGAEALQVNLSGLAAGSQTRFIAINPYGLPVESTSSLVCYSSFSDPKVCNPVSRAYNQPLPGIWEIEVESRRTSPTLDNPFRIAAVVQGVTVSPEEIVLPSVKAGTAAPVQWTLQNAFGPVTVKGVGGPLGSSRSQRPTIADGDTSVFTLDVPAGASSLDVSIGNPSDPGADLDLEVYRGTTLVGVDADGDSEESVSLANPVAGSYEVHVVGYAVPAGTTEYDYRDVFSSPELGQLAVNGASVTLANGQSAIVRGTVTALQAPAQGRQLLGEMRVVSEAGAVVGRGSVLVQSVTPAG